MPDPATSPRRTIDVFTRGYAALRSRTHPYLVDRLGPLWYFHDAPRRDPRPERSREVVALAATRPATAARRIEQANVGRHTLCVYHQAFGRDEKIESAYKNLGYRCGRHEAVFVYRLPPAPTGPMKFEVRRIIDPAVARLIASKAGSRQIDENDLDRDEAEHRLFAVIEAGDVLGYCSSIRVDNDAAWVANVHVFPGARRRGVGSSLMRAMLRDDQARGVRHSFLTATGLGALLYRGVGYEQLGTLQVFHRTR